MKTIPDAVDVDSTLISGKPEVQLEVDRDTAADLGVRVGDVSQALNTLVAGQEATTFNEGTDQYDVTCTGDQSVSHERRGPETADRPVGKSWLGDARPRRQSRSGTGPSSVDRTQPPASGDAACEYQARAARRRASRRRSTSMSRQLNLPAEYKTGYVGQSKEMGKAAFYFLLAFMLSFIFMYIVLAAQFESFIHPVTILLTLPLSIPFGIFSLLVTGQTVNIFSGLGLLLLVRRRQKERDPADRPHERSAVTRNEPLRRDHPGKSRPSAADPDDDDRAGRRNDPARCRRAVPVRAQTARSAYSWSADRACVCC